LFSSQQAQVSSFFGTLPEGFASGNGRVEATEVDVAAKHQGRVEAVLVKEGDMVEQGQLLAQMDAAVLRAQLAEAGAAAQRAQADRAVAAATATQRLNEHDLAVRERDRAHQLAKQGLIEKSKLESDVTAEQTAKALLDAARAQVASADAKVSFVSPTAQFTPKEVETRSEREKLMFRVKVRIDPELLRPYAERVKTGLPGVGYVRLDPSAPWPEHLKTREERGLPRLIPPSSSGPK
jgi:HlyD family secretion protein